MEMSLLRFFLFPLTFFVLTVSYAHPNEVAQDESISRLTTNSTLWTRIFVMDTVRERVDFTGSVEINYPAARGSEVKVTALELLYGGEAYVNMPLSIRLMGDGGWFDSLTRDIEKLPPEISYLYVQRKDFPVDYYRSLRREEREYIHEDILDRIDAAREDPYFLLDPPVGLIKFTVPLTEMVPEDHFKPFLDIPLTIRIHYEGETWKRIIELDHTITVDEPLPKGPQGISMIGDTERMTLQGVWYYGDLHVHDCKDEVSIIGERGCPTCYAETLNWGADNSLSEMKDQYTAMGANWFTITSHSYCVESEGEYNNVVSQANSLTNADFIVVPDTELQSEEEGPQEGDDDGNLVCLNGVNHMGAHWITSWKAGGQDGLLQFCDEPIYGFRSNIQEIRSEGGFGIINHPTGTSWGWNSYEYTHGFTRPDGFRGVEIWNGPFRDGQGGAVGWWVRKLLDGEPMYAYSGSDTHDDVYDFGWNHVYIPGMFTKDNLRNALISGRLYISNFQALFLIIRDLDTNRRALMGGGFPIVADSDLEISIYYDFGTRTGNIMLFKGVVGDPDESIFHQEDGLTGNGWLNVQDLSPTMSGLVYYRAYSTVTSGGNYSAYSNPVWARVIPSTR
jgi:hypothetical protein